MGPEIEIILIAVLVSIACALVGVFLVLRKVSLMSDAISHSVLLGIVLAFFVTESLSSPLLIIGAALTGVLTVSLTEILINTKKVKKDAAIGLVFPLLFSIAVILITRFAENVHLDVDSILLGELAFAPFNRLVVGGLDIGAEALWVIGVILVISVGLLLLFYKELKIATFDPALAATLGFSPLVIHYGLMSVVSVVAVGAFDIVGSILVVALMIAPPAAAYMFTDKLKTMLFASAGIGALSAIAGYGMAFVFDVSIAGSMATIAGVLFALAVFFAPHRGILYKWALHNKRKVWFAADLLLVHLLAHESKPEAKQENTFQNAKVHMRWTDLFARKIIDYCATQDYIHSTSRMLFLTEKGRLQARAVMNR